MSESSFGPRSVIFFELFCLSFSYGLLSLSPSRSLALSLSG